MIHALVPFVIARELKHFAAQAADHFHQPVLPGAMALAGCRPRFIPEEFAGGVRAEKIGGISFHILLTDRIRMIWRHSKAL